MLPATGTPRSPSPALTLCLCPLPLTLSSLVVFSLFGGLGGWQLQPEKGHLGNRRWEPCVSVAVSMMTDWQGEKHS